MLYACTTYLNDRNMYIRNNKVYLKTMVKYLILRRILIDCGEYGFAEKCLMPNYLTKIFLAIPCHIITPIVRKKDVIFNSFR